MSVEDIINEVRDAAGSATAALVSLGVKRLDEETANYKISAYMVGEVIRIDLKPKF